MSDRSGRQRRLQARCSQIRTCPSWAFGVSWQKVMLPVPKCQVIRSFVFNTARAHHSRAPSRQKGHSHTGRSGGLGGPSSRAAPSALHQTASRAGRSGDRIMALIMALSLMRLEVLAPGENDQVHVKPLRGKPVWPMQSGESGDRALVHPRRSAGITRAHAASRGRH